MQVHVFRLIALCSTLAGTLLVAMATGGPPYYRVVDIHNLGHASAISDAGHVVGWSDYVYGPGVVPHAHLWHDGNLEDLNPLGGHSRAYGVNSQGHVVGRFFEQDGQHLFLWLPVPAFNLPAGFNDLGVLDAARPSMATDINERSEIVGTTGYTVFLWLPYPAFGLPAGMNDLCKDWPLHNDCPTSETARINNLGQVLTDNWLWQPQAAYGRPRGWWQFYQSGENYRFQANAFNSSGLTVATIAVFSDPYYFAAGSLWDDHPGGAFGFGDPLAEGDGVAINEQGIILGDVWVKGPVLVDATVLGEYSIWTLDDRILYGGDWKRWSAVDINDRFAIAGNALEESGQYHAIVLFPINTDVTGSGRTNLFDLSFFQTCFWGPSVNAAPSCTRCDFEEDADVDLSDFQALQLGFDGRY